MAPKAKLGGTAGKVAAAAAATAAGAAAAKTGLDARARRADRRAARLFRLHDGEPAGEGLRRIARGQLDIAAEGLHSDDEHGEGIHTARKALERLRTTIRLARDQLVHDRRRRANATFRDAGRRLSGPRDARVMLQTLDALRDRHADELDMAALAGLRDALADENEAARRAHAEDPAAVEEVGGQLRRARARIARWQLDDDPAHLARGLRRIYRRGRKALRAAARDPSTEALHELRKRAKDLWHAARILRPADPKRLRRVARRAHRLSDLLGEEHDLAVLSDYATRHRARVKEDAAFAGLEGIIARRRRALQRDALSVAKRLYRPAPRKLARLRARDLRTAAPAARGRAGR